LANLATAAPDPNETISFLQSSRSAEPHLSEIGCSKAAARDLTQPANNGHPAILQSRQFSVQSTHIAVAGCLNAAEKLPELAVVAAGLFV